MKVNSIDIKLLADGSAELVMITRDRSALNHISMMAANGGDFEVNVKKFRERRSLNANGMYWKFNDELSKVLGIGREELHLQTLKEYGVRGYIACETKKIDIYKKQFKDVEIIGECTVNGKPGTQLRVTVGSHLYNTEEFSRLLNGLLMDCKDQGIPIIAQEEFDRLMVEYESEVR